MDSLTQIVLGAAVGEVCLGRKLGNKAMVWGAIAGTIPDLDVVVGKVLFDRLGQLAFHRAISHSIFFALTFSVVMAYAAQSFYRRGFHLRRGWRMAGKIFGTLFALLLSCIGLLLGYVFGKWTGITIAGVLVLPIAGWCIYQLWRSMANPVDIVADIPFKSWYWYFFWSIFTHPILDCFTTYGTQLFQPFSDYRVCWDNISVADPIYTIVFGLCVLLAAQYARTDFRRLRFTYMGIALATLYMNWTFHNKAVVNSVLQDTLTEMDIKYKRYMTGPTILNNLLWTGTAEADSSLWIGQYSLLDAIPKFDLVEIPKNLHMMPTPRYEEDPTVKVLRWFSNDYCAIMARDDGQLQMTDLRFGLMNYEQPTHPDNGIFRFVLDDVGGEYQLCDEDPAPPPGSEDRIAGQLWNRMMGRKE